MVMKWLGLMLVVAAFAAMTSSLTALPTAEDVVDQVILKIDQISSLEGDMKISQTGGDIEADFHFLLSVKVVDGKVVQMHSSTCRVTRKDRDGKPVVDEGKVVSDGVFDWLETRRAGDPRIEVKKSRVKEGEEFWYLEMVHEMKTTNAEFNWTLGEETVDGKKMYVLEKHGDRIPRTTIKADVTEKVWVGEDDLLIHRRTIETRITDPNMGPNPGAPRTRVMELANLKVDQPVDEKLFQYVPPEGAVVTEEKEP